MEHFDVIVMGAGLSGVGAACHLKMKCPDRSFVILEGRERMGGTWDLFRYPGIRSDSDMYTLGYSFRPWTDSDAIADGSKILQYIQDTAREYDVERKIRFQHRVVQASWSSRDAKWTVQVERGENRELVSFTCNFVFGCGGYYRYEAGYTPVFPGVSRFRGQIVHPQHWKEDTVYEGKRVIVIGSGATAVTLVPALSRRATHVTMLQRSPTYVVSRPAQDALAGKLRRHFSAQTAYSVTRWKNVTLGMLFYQLSRRRPDRVKRLIIAGVKQAMGPAYDVGKHFTPDYNPWDQRLCLVPNGDLFRALKSGKASVVTDQIETFNETGIRLRSGEELEADLIVTATGLELEVMGGVSLFVDGERVNFADKLNYKGSMLEGVPNAAMSAGYTNASWTLKCDLTCDFVCRTLNLMKAKGYTSATPRNRGPAMATEPVINFSSGYVQRALDKLPKQGSRAPWRLHQNYALDLMNMRWSRIEDGVLEFAR